MYVGMAVVLYVCRDATVLSDSAHNTRGHCSIYCMHRRDGTCSSVGGVCGGVR